MTNLDNDAISLFYYDHSTDKMIIFDRGETWGIGLNEGFLQLEEGRININPSYKDCNTHVKYQSLSAYLKEDYNYPFYDRLIIAYDDAVKLGDVWRYLTGIFGKIPGARFVNKLHLAAFYNGANLMNYPDTILLRQGDKKCTIDASCSGIIEILGREELGEDRILYKRISDEDFSQELIAGALIWQHIWEHTTLGNDLVFLDCIPFEVKLGIFPDKLELVFPEYTTIPCKKTLEIEKGYAPQLYIKYADEIFVCDIDECFKNDAELTVCVEIDTNNLPCIEISSLTHPYPITVTWDKLIDSPYDIGTKEETERDAIHESTHYEEAKMNDFKTKKKCINALPPKAILHGPSYTYEIVEALGQGSFGISYLANVRLSGALGELQSSVQVAIKEFFMKDTNGRQGSSVTSGGDSEVFQNYRKDFIREANNLARMKHPHIVKVLEAFEANNTCYFSMEYIDGENLNEYISQCQSLSERESLQSIVEIGEALAFMHENRMLHLDLKPLNVMRHKDGRLVLIDFGLSKQFGENGEPETSTRIGLGTPGYAPLEQASYKKGEGFPATLDIYALGATLFKMLTGKTPPNASVLFNEGFPEDDFRQCGVSEDVISLVSWTMEPMKRKRPQTVNAFLDEAKRLLPDSSTIHREKPKTSQKTFTKNTDGGTERYNGFTINWKKDLKDSQKMAVRQLLEGMIEIGANNVYDNNEYQDLVAVHPVMSSGEYVNAELYKQILGVEATDGYFGAAHLTVSDAIKFILKLQQYTGLPFRFPDGRSGIKATAAPFYWYEYPGLHYLPEKGFVHFSDGHAKQIQGAEELYIKTYCLEIICDSMSPMIVNGIFDVEWTQVVYNQLEPIGFGFYRAEKNHRWSVVTPNYTLDSLLLQEYEEVSCIDLYTIPGPGPLSLPFLGVIAHADGKIACYELKNGKFNLLTEMSNDEWKEREAWT